MNASLSAHNTAKAPFPQKSERAPYDVIINHGLWFDGTGAPAAIRNIGIRAGRVATISSEPLDMQDCPDVLDAKGQWVMPGFVDIHTHYDAEILVAPGLTESVRHGVTSIFLGSCSLSTVYSSPLDCADLFSRVEAIPRDRVLSALEQHKTWTTPAGYIAALEALPLGPNVAAFLGHSDLRAHVMGLGRSVDDHVRPDKAELHNMASLIEEALDAGFLGLSSMTTPWDKLDGERFRSKSLPSTFATWREHRWFNRVLRRRNRVLQSAPNTTNPLNGILFFLESSGCWVRKALKTSLLVAADAKAAPSFLIHFLTMGMGLWNRILNGNLRWQHLPLPFEVYADGIDFVVFEEFGSGRAALHIKDAIERNHLLQDESYRRQFRRECEKGFDMRLWKRDFYDMEIIDCPDQTVIGQTFGQVADDRKIHPTDAFLDLVVEFGTLVRWKTTIANHRPKILDQIAGHRTLQLGFADSGAHLRNMAFYNMPVRFLKRVYAAQQAGTPFMGMEQAVHRLTGELAEWYGVDAGRLRVGDRADITIIDPVGLNDSVDAYLEGEIAEFGHYRRITNNSDVAVVATLIGGQLVCEHGVFVEGYGQTRRTGRFLRVGEPRGSVIEFAAKNALFRQDEHFVNV
jgi:N-acyl-D-aspartate/D-glutamate deacylase